MAAGSADLFWLIGSFHTINLLLAYFYLNLKFFGLI